MSNDTNSIIFESALKIIRPLIRVMLRNGVSNGSFEELVRKAYVDEAFSLGDKSPGKTTISSVSAQTGLSRKEVKRLAELDDAHHTEIEQKYNRAVRVISGWVNDKRFSDSAGNGKTLPMEGEISFSSLVKEYSGDIPTKAMLDLLLVADCVVLKQTSSSNDASKSKNKIVELIKHAYVPSNDSSGIIRILGTDTNELIKTIDYNLTTNEKNRRFQRKVSTAALDKNAVKEFKTISNKSSQALLEELDAWISKHEIKSNHKNARYVSVGIYFYQDNDDEE